MAKNWMSSLKNANNEWIALITSKSSNYFESNIKIIKFLAKTKGMNGVLVVLNRPFSDFRDRLKKEKIDPSKFFIIDCATKLSDSQPKRQENVLFLSSPRNLSDVSVAIDQGLNAIEGDKFLFLDSLSTLLIYHESTTITQFIHFLTSKLRNSKVKGVIILLEKDLNDKIGKVVSQFADMVLEVR